MVHDKIKAATRERMVRTGETYTVARRAVIEEHRLAQEHKQGAEAAISMAAEATSPWTSVTQQVVADQVASMAAVRDALQARSAVFDQIAEAAAISGQAMEAHRIVEHMTESGVLRDVLDAQRTVMSHISQSGPTFR